MEVKSGAGLTKIDQSAARLNTRATPAAVARACDFPGAHASRVLASASSRSRTFSVREFPGHVREVNRKRLFRRDAETSTRDGALPETPRSHLVDGRCACDGIGNAESENQSSKLGDSCCCRLR